MENLAIIGSLKSYKLTEKDLLVFHCLSVIPKVLLCLFIANVRFLCYCAHSSLCSVCLVSVLVDVDELPVAVNEFQICSISSYSPWIADGR